MAACRADDVGARFGEPDRERAADAARRAGDDRDLTLEWTALEGTVGAQASLVAGRSTIPPSASSWTAGTGSGSANTSASR